MTLVEEGFRREGPEPALEAADKDGHAYFHDAGVAFEAAVSQLGRWDCPDQLPSGPAEALHDGRGDELLSQRGPRTPDVQIVEPHPEWVALEFKAGLPVEWDLGRGVSEGLVPGALVRRARWRVAFAFAPEGR